MMRKIETVFKNVIFIIWYKKFPNVRLFSVFCFRHSLVPARQCLGVKMFLALLKLMPMDG